MRLETIYLEVGDSATVSSCRDFYAERLGLSIMSEEPGESVWLDGEGVRLGFHVGDPPDKPGGINLSFEVTNVDDEAARLTESGVTLEQPPVEVPWGGRVTTLYDPAGHAVWLSEPAKAE